MGDEHVVLSLEARNGVILNVKKEERQRESESEKEGERERE